MFYFDRFEFHFFVQACVLEREKTNLKSIRFNWFLYGIFFTRKIEPAIQNESCKKEKLRAEGPNKEINY